MSKKRRIDVVGVDGLSFGELHYLHCNNCGKQVSSGFVPVTVTDHLGGAFDGLVVRAWVECPECLQARSANRRESGRREAKGQQPHRRADKEA